MKSLGNEQLDEMRDELKAFSELDKSISDIDPIDIPEIVEKTLCEAPCQNLDTLDSVVENDQLSRQIAQSFVGSGD